jgi:phage major head subunit gpT-like protein
MVTFTNTFPELLETRQKTIFFKYYAMQELMFPKVFKRQSSSGAFEDRMRVQGLGTLAMKAEGTPIAFDDPIEGARIRTVHQTFGLGYRHTEEALEDDRWNILDKMPADLGDSARDHQETLAWGLINDGFAGAIYTGLDALPLFSAAHTNVDATITQSNLLAPAVALSVTGLEDIMTLSRTIQSDEGRFVNINQGLLLYHPANEHNAKVLMGTEQRPGTADHDISTVSTTASGLVPVRPEGVPYLASTTAWYVFDTPARSTLTWNDRREMRFDRARDAVTFDQMHMVSYRASAMFSKWEGSYGSNAT